MDKLKSLKDWMKDKGMNQGNPLEEANNPRVQLTYARLMLEQNLENIDKDLVGNLRSFLKQEQFSELSSQDKLGLLVASAYAAVYPNPKS